MLLPDRLRELWAEADAGKITRDEAALREAEGLGELRAEWRAALTLPGEPDLRASLLREVALRRGIADLGEVEQSFGRALGTMKDEWHRIVRPGEPESVDRYYEIQATIDELMDWHSLQDDPSPLAYVLARQIATEHGARRCLDFGSGVGSGAILFSRAGIDMTLADVSSTLLDFCRWRLERRAIRARFVDLKVEALPVESFDMVLAMDVFEHLVEPTLAAENIHAALRPGGLLFARIHAEDDPERPQHVAQDFGPTFARMAELGLVEIWRDGWLWGHQLFQKR